MSEDIVERLRSEHRMALAPLHMSDAADEIERLRAAGDVLAAYVRYLGPGRSGDTAALDAWRKARRRGS